MAVAARARRYAQAIAQIAREQNNWDQWLTELSQLATLQDEPGVLVVMESPRVPLAKKREILQQRLPALSPFARNVAELLIQRGRFDLMPEIRDELQQSYDKVRGIEHARVISAVPLQPAEQAAIQQQLATYTGKQVLITTEVDPGIIAGLVVRIGDKLLDGSARGRLELLRKQLLARA